MLLFLKPNKLIDQRIEVIAYGIVNSCFKFIDIAYITRCNIPILNLGNMYRISFYNHSMSFRMKTANLNTFLNITIADCSSYCTSNTHIYYWKIGSL